MDGNMVTLGIALLSIAAGVLGFALKALYSKTESNESKINAHQLDVAANFVPRTELANALVSVRADGKALEDRLEKRFDKMEDWMGRRFDELLGRTTKPKE